MSRIAAAIRDRVEATCFVDTHEHLPDESTRLSFKPSNADHAWDRVIRDKVDDWSFLFSLYACDDLCSAGLAPDVMRRFWREEGAAQTKFEWIAQKWRNIRHTGYGQALRHTLRTLYGEDDLTCDSAPRIAERYLATRAPGFYETVLRKIARVDHCHVNSFESTVFRRTEMPALLRQDIDMTLMTDPGGFTRVAAELDVELTTLEDWLAQIDRIFRLHGPHAAAVKLQTAYSRNLNIAPSDRRRAEYAFGRYKARFGFGPEEQVDLHNFLIRYIIERATQARLPVKFHTGIGCAATLYGDPTPIIPLAHVQGHQRDLCQLYQAYPDCRFVIFHIGYPYHHEVVAVAKQYHNVFVDMCWAWIIDPVQSVQFLRSYLTSAPSNKLFTFGGDHIVVEPVVGHAHIARLGICRALTSLVEERLLALEDTGELIEALMRGNALAIFGASGAPEKSGP
jgi:uncharacterized protein